MKSDDNKNPTTIEAFKLLFSEVTGARSDEIRTVSVVVTYDKDKGSGIFQHHSGDPFAISGALRSTLRTYEKTIEDILEKNRREVEKRGLDEGGESEVVP